MFSKIMPLLTLQHVAQNCTLRITEQMSESPLISAFPPQGAALMRNRAMDAVQALWNKAAHDYNACEYCSLAHVKWWSNMKELNFFEHAVMRLCLHGEHAEMHKEQVKDVSVFNVHQHKEWEGEEWTRASSREVVGQNWRSTDESDRDDFHAVQTTSNPARWAHYRIKYTGSIAKVGRQGKELSNRLGNIWETNTIEQPSEECSQPLLESMIYVATRPRIVAPARSTILRRVCLFAALSSATRGPLILFVIGIPLRQSNLDLEIQVNP